MVSFLGGHRLGNLLILFITPALLPLEHEQRIAIFHALCSSRCGKQRLVIRQRIHKLSAYVGPAAAAFSLLQLVVAVEPIADRISAVVYQESRCMVTVPGRLVLEQNIAVFVYLAVAVDPHTGI